MKIVVSEPQTMADDVKVTLAELGEVVYGPFDERVLRHELADCDVLMVRLGHRIDEALLSAAPRLRFIVSATTGLDHIDVAAATGRGIRVISLRDCADAIRDVSATAEHAWGLLLALARRSPAAIAHVADGGWDRNRFWGTQLRGKRLGIVGYGRIGAMVARYGAAFGMEVLACDTDDSRITAPASAVALDKLVEAADVISVHVTASAGNRHLIDRNLLEKLKPGALLINTSRGLVMDEAAVADALSSGRLAGVAIDVLEGEEKNAVPSSALLACARRGLNVLITPHIGGATRESIATTERAVVSQLAVALRKNE
jgi:D-3-phosphoglycerate dehydrogenase